MTAIKSELPFSAVRDDTLVEARSGSPVSGQSASVREECDWLIDNASAYERLIRSIRRARQSVWITQLALDNDCMAYGASDTPAASLAQVIVDAAKSRVGDVRILMNQTLLLDTVAPLRKWLASRSADTIRVRGMSRFPQLLHAKMAIVDGTEVFLIGSPFVNGYWDDSRHLPTDERRPMRELGGRPLHDVSVRLTGSVVHEAEALYDEWWRMAEVDTADAGDLPMRVKSKPIGHSREAARVRLVSTSPTNQKQRGRVDILYACLDGISRARSLIYIEHQYLSARLVVDALNSALEKNIKLEVVMVLNQNPDVTAYRRWQNDRLRQSGLLGHPRVGVFSLWSTERGGDRIIAASQVFVHSKVLIVDDAWGMVGSANLDGVSLYSYGDDFRGPLARRIFRNVRNFDANVVIRDGIDGVTRTGDLAALRMRLWAEHLGTGVRAMQTRPVAGWLPLWRKRADRNVIALDRNDSRHVFRGFVLPYSAKSTPRKQLADLGIRIRSGSPELRFEPGLMEVYLSPNWVRNMFL